MGVGVGVGQPLEGKGYIWGGSQKKEELETTRWEDRHRQDNGNAPKSLENKRPSCSACHCCWWSGHILATKCHRYPCWPPPGSSPPHILLPPLILKLFWTNQYFSPFYYSSFCRKHFYFRNFQFLDCFYWHFRPLALTELPLCLCLYSSLSYIQSTYSRMWTPRDGATMASSAFINSLNFRNNQCIYQLRELQFDGVIFNLSCGSRELEEHSGNLIFLQRGVMVYEILVVVNSLRILQL